MNSYITYFTSNIKYIGVYGLIFIAICYVLYIFKKLSEDNKMLIERVAKQNNDIETQKKIINAIQNNKPRTLSDNFKRMRSEK